MEAMDLCVESISRQRMCVILPSLCHLFSRFLNWLSISGKAIWSLMLMLPAELIPTSNLPHHGSLDQRYAIASSQDNDCMVITFMLALLLPECNKHNRSPFCCRTQSASCLLSCFTHFLYMYKCICVAVCDKTLVLGLPQKRNSNLVECITSLTHIFAKTGTSQLMKVYLWFTSGGKANCSINKCQTEGANGCQRQGMIPKSGYM